MGTAAAPRLSRRTLERRGMTPEQELDLLVQEQREDDTPWQRPPNGNHWVSLDAPAPDGEGGSIGDELVGRDPWDLINAAIDLGLEPTELAFAGEIVDSLPPRRGVGLGSPLADPRRIPHGTAGGYQNHKCKCQPCTIAWATYKRERRAARRAEG